MKISIEKFDLNFSFILTQPPKFSRTRVKSASWTNPTQDERSPCTILKRPNPPGRRCASHENAGTPKTQCGWCISFGSQNSRQWSSVIRIPGEETCYQLYYSEVVGNSGRHGIAIAPSEASQAEPLVWVPISPRLAGVRINGATVTITLFMRTFKMLMTVIPQETCWVLHGAGMKYPVLGKFALGPRWVTATIWWISHRPTAVWFPVLASSIHGATLWHGSPMTDASGTTRACTVPPDLLREGLPGLQQGWNRQRTWLGSCNGYCSPKPTHEGSPPFQSSSQTWHGEVENRGTKKSASGATEPFCDSTETSLREMNGDSSRTWPQNLLKHTLEEQVGVVTASPVKRLRWQNKHVWREFNVCLINGA